ncbi:ThuA domain-containing protein [Paenibacillus sp. 1P07SE]|uniref:ThuA domain-containing protein n=1 Tax=Paenibacillus sp. 1P07SE TaxID=3132209 RepID=UPI0039A45BD9
MNQPVRVTIWNEYRHEMKNPVVREVYPEGIHKAIGASLPEHHTVVYATLDEEEHGLTEQRLQETDVLLWWGHTAHGEVQEEIVQRVYERVLQGMGLIVLHSGHFSKIFKKLMGTSCDLKWRDQGEKERLWVVKPGHPIVRGIGEYIELPKEEMYGEHFDIPQPDELIFTSWFEGGEIFRSGCCWTRGKGKIFYFRPGHETFPTYHNLDVQRVIANSIDWAAPVGAAAPQYGNAKPLEELAY